MKTPQNNSFGTQQLTQTHHMKKNILSDCIGWWFVDLDGDFGWVPASFLTPRDGEDDFDDDIIEKFGEGEGIQKLPSIDNPCFY